MTVEKQRQRLLKLIVQRFADIATIKNETLHINEQLISLAPLLGVFKYITESKEFTQLPPLFDASENFPIADMYVELTVSQFHGLFDKLRLQRGLTLAEEQEERHKRHHAEHLSVEQCINIPQNNKIVILGDPGSGKTSLLKYLSLSIAKGKTPRWIIPIFISLRYYWLNKQKNPSLSLLNYAITQLFTLHTPTQTTHSPLFTNKEQKKDNTVEQLAAMLEELTFGEYKHILFLLDGFDEIATQSEAIDIISAEIKQLSKQFSWILTSRHTGFYGGLNEDVCYEVVSLNNAGIEELVTSWFKNSGHQNHTLGKQTILNQLQANPRLRDMARNPFLLTLLCYVQHNDLSQLLPLQRNDVYAKIIDLIRQQLRTVKRDETLFRNKELTYIAKFSYYLYTDVENAPIQIFEYDHWDTCALPNDPPNFNKHFLPSRIINSWQQGGNFHFTHLTFQEYFIALHLAKQNFENIKNYHFLPYWKVIFRFLAGIYSKQKDKENYSKLLHSLLSPVDKSGVLYIEVSHYLIEAGIEDSTPILGYDLREKLWHIWESGADYAQESAGEALAILSPNYILKKIKQYLHKNRKISIHIKLLGMIDTPESDALLINLLSSFEREYKQRAIYAIAEKNTYSIRNAVIELYLSNKPHWFTDFCNIARQTKHYCFIPHLKEYLQISPNSLDEYKVLFNAITAINTTELEDELLSFIKQYKLEELSLPLIQALTSLKTGKIRDWVNETIPTEHPKINQHIIASAISYDLLEDKAVISYLKTTNTSIQAAYLRAIKYKISINHYPNEAILRTIANIAFSNSYNADKALTIIEQSYFEHFLNEKELIRYKDGCRSYLYCNDMEMSLSATAILSRLHDEKSFPIILNRLHTGSDIAAVINELFEYKDIYPKEIKKALHQLYAQIYRDNSYIAETILAVLSRIDLNEVLKYSHDPYINIANILAKYSAMEGVLIFDDYYIDKLGNKHSLKLSKNILPPYLTKLDKNRPAYQQENEIRQICHYLLDSHHACKTSVNENANPPPLFTKPEAGLNENKFTYGVSINTGNKFLKGEKKIRPEKMEEIKNRLYNKFKEFFINS